jgi:hypothetical protein
MAGNGRAIVAVVGFILIRKVVTLARRACLWLLYLEK